ncbi:SRPBCC family protein [Promineifilum sp.]|uniref:SRPBCC family protein n=1 Tax=Promineifilum sp. TaxID=2664178 RepID=UPI0035B1D21A
MTERVSQTVIVKSDVSTAYNVWSNFETFPYFMKYVEKVEKIGPQKSYWEVKGPLGTTVQWTAETTRLDVNTRIGWNTKDNAGTMTTSGEVVFTELPDNQTQITVTMNYTPPGGKLGEVVAQLFADPDKRLEEDLRNFKAYVENGR